MPEVIILVRMGADVGDWHKPRASFYDKRSFDTFLGHDNVVPFFPPNYKTIELKYPYKGPIMEGSNFSL